MLVVMADNDVVGVVGDSIGVTCVAGVGVGVRQRFFVVSAMVVFVS